MDNRNNGYGALLLLLSQLMGSSRQNPQPQNSVEDAGGATFGEVYFAQDETKSRWRREEKVELLAEFCREGYAMAKRHGHFLIGNGADGSFIGIPGRFLLEEQPAGGVTGFTLWQPLAGGEELYESLEDLDADAADTVYGYWIAGLDPETLKLKEF
jgi:hypothetical protein